MDNTGWVVERIGDSGWVGEWEIIIGSFEEATRVFEALSRTSQPTSPFGFIWRGQEDASWPLHSTLYRDLAGHSAGKPGETELASHEHERFQCARDEWMLDRHSSGPLGGLELLAAIQHMGGHTTRTSGELINVDGGYYAHSPILVGQRRVIAEMQAERD